MTITLTVGADAEGHLLAVRSRIVADAGGYHTTSAKCALRAACHTCGPYRVPNVDVESKAVYTNNPNSGAMRGFGSNQAQFAMEGVMDILAEKVGVDGWDIRMRNILNPGDEFATGQVMRESVRGMKASMEAVKDLYKKAKYKGIGCGIKSTGLGNGTTEGGYITIRVVEGPPPRRSSTATPRWGRGSTRRRCRRCARRRGCRREHDARAAGTRSSAGSAARRGPRAARRLSAAAARRRRSCGGSEEAVRLKPDTDERRRRSSSWSARSTTASTS